MCSFLLCMCVNERRRNEWWVMKLIKPKFMIFFLSPHTSYSIPNLCMHKISDFLINQMSSHSTQLRLFLWWCSLLIEISSVIYQSITDKTEQRSMTICRSPIIIILLSAHMTARILPTKIIISVLLEARLWRGRRGGLYCLNVNGINTWRGHFRWLCLWSAVMSEWWWKV